MSLIYLVLAIGLWVLYFRMMKSRNFLTVFVLAFAADFSAAWTKHLTGLPYDLLFVGFLLLGLAPISGDMIAAFKNSHPNESA